jgi:YD repeat-containing protein
LRFREDKTRVGINYPYTYDLDGNRTKETQTSGGTTSTTTYIYNADNEMTSQTVGGTTTSFTYDSNGSQLTNGGTTYTYNVRNELNTATTSGVTTSYVYDDAGDRVQETTGSTTTYYLIDDNNPTGYAEPIEVRVGSATGTPTTTYILGDRVIGQANSSGAVSYLLVDGQDDTRALVNSSGAVTAVFNYDAFGNPIGFTAATAPTVFLFQETMFDAPSGLNFFDDGQREEVLGAPNFIEADPSTYIVQSEPLTLNLRLMDGADPANNIDLNGHDFELGDLLLTADIGLSLDYSAAVTPYAIAQSFGLVNDVPSSDDPQESSWFDSVSDDLAVFGGYVEGFAEGAAQGVFNVINGIQDAIIGTANLAIQAELAMLGPVGLEFNVSIPSPDWSYGLIYNEPPTQHAISKFLGGIGASLASSGGFGILGAVGEGGLTADELSLTETVANSAATRPYINSRLLVQEIMDSGPGAADPGGIPGGLRWDVEGAFNGSKGIYELVVNPATKQIVHFLFTSS